MNSPIVIASKRPASWQSWTMRSTWLGGKSRREILARLFQQQRQPFGPPAAMPYRIFHLHFRGA